MKRDNFTLPIGLRDELIIDNFGERPMQAGLVDQPQRNITTLPELLALICDAEATQ